MTTETKPIIDLSEWEECTEEEWGDLHRRDRGVVGLGDEERYLKRKPKPPPLVKSLEKKVYEHFDERVLTADRRMLVDIARIIEEHAKERGWDK